MKKKIVLFITAVAAVMHIQAQVTSYVFTQQNGSYTPLAAETVLWSVMFDDEVQEIMIPEFVFNEVPYTTLTVSTNGFITFGSEQPAVNYYTPISGTAGYAGAISAFGQNLEQSYSGTPKISYNTNVDGEIVIQWQNVARPATTGDDVSFQIRLNPVNNSFLIVYGTCTTTYASTGSSVQVGLRGTANTDYNNRYTTSNWAATTAGTSNSAACRFNSTIYPESGLTFSWESLHNPSGFTAQALSEAAIGLSWEKNTSDMEVLLASNTSSSFGTPVNGTVYSAGNSIAGGGTVIYAGNLEEFINSGLNTSTLYYYKIWSKSSANNYSPGVSVNRRTAYILPYSHNFNSTTGFTSIWEGTFSRTNYHGILNSYGLTAEMNSSNSSRYEVSPCSGPVTANSSLSFAYRIVDVEDYPANATVLGAGDEMLVEISADDGYTYSTLYTINQSNHTASTDFRNVSLSLPAYTGDYLRVRFTVNRTQGEFFVDVDNLMISDNSNMIYTGSTSLQNNTSNVAIGSSNNEILALHIFTEQSNNPLSVNSITFNTTGCTSPATDITVARVFYTTGNTFSDAVQFGGDVNSPSGTFIVNGTQELASGANYFWLAYSISAAAVAGNVVDARCTAFVTSESGSSKIPAQTNPDGNRIIGQAYSGIYTVPGDFTSIAAAIAALNAGVIGSGGVTINVAAGHTESAASDIVLTATGTASNPIVFQKAGSGNNPLVTRSGAGSVNTTILGNHGDGVLILQGSDYVTFDGIDVTTTDQGIEYGYYLRNSSVSDACKSIVIKNASILMNRGSSAMVIGICAANNSSTASNISVSMSAGAHADVILEGNVIGNVFTGIYVKGHSTYFHRDFTIGTATAGNTIQNYGGGATGAAYGVNLLNVNDSEINFNQINNTAGGGTAFLGEGYGIYNQTGNINGIVISENVISLTSASSNQGLYGIRNAAAIALDISDNSINLQNTLSSSGVYAFIHNSINTVSAENQQITGNAFSGSFESTGTAYLIYNHHSSGYSGDVTVSDNTVDASITRAGSSGDFYCYYKGASSTETETFEGNNFSNISVAGITRFYGISSSTSAGHTHQAIGNTFSNISGGTGNMVLMDFSSSTSREIRNNLFENIVSGGLIDVVRHGSGNSVSHISGNRISGITSNSSSTTLSITGLTVSSGTEVYIYNNIICELYTPSINSIDAIRAINLTSTLANSTIGVYHNTVYLDAETSASTLGTTALYHTSSNVSTTASLDLRNNILINKSVAKGSSGRSVVLRRSSSYLENFNLLSDNNIMYAGTPGAVNVLYYNGSVYQTLEAYQAHVSPRESCAGTEDCPFTNVSATPYNLHFAPGTVTLAESGGISIVSPVNINTDFDGDARQTPPDAGADEFAGVSALVLNPDSFEAVASSSQDITLTFTPNSSSDVVVIVFNVTGTFTDPEGTPQVGQPLAGGTVVASGLTSPVVHGSLTIGTAYYYKAFSWNGASYSRGLTSQASPSVEPVTQLAAVAESKSVIGLSWTKNEAAHEVLLAAHSSYMSGNPVNGTAYSVGASVPGGGTVIYKGPATAFDFEGLATWSQHYFRIWSVDAYNYYSTGVTEKEVTYADVITEFPYIQNFDGNWSHSPAAPEGWEVEDFGSSSFTWVRYNIISFSGAAMARGYGSGICNDYLISPPLELPGYDIQLSWRDMINNVSNTSNYEVRLSLSGKNYEDFTVLLGSYSCTNTSWQLHTLDLSAYKNQKVHIAFYQTSTVSQYQVFGIDEVIIEGVVPGSATDPEPMDGLLTFTGDVELSWEPPVSSYSLNYKLYLGDTPGSETLIYDGPLTNYTAQLPDNDETYYWYVSPENENGTAAQVPVWTLNTVTSTQLAESFEDDWFPPVGWSSTGGIWVHEEESAYHGTKRIRKGTGLAESMLITPLLSIENGSKLEFFCGTASSTYQRIQIKYSTDRTLWTPIGSEITVEQGAWGFHSVDLSVLDGAQYYIAFSVYYVSGGATAYVFFDHITGPEIVPLPPAQANTPNPADQAEWVEAQPVLTWQPGNSGGVPVGYRVYLGTDGGGTATPTNVVNGQEVIAATFSLAQPLLNNTQYYWKIVPFNAVGDALDCPVWSFSVIPENAVLIETEQETNIDLPINSGFSYSYSQTIYQQSDINISGLAVTRVYYHWGGGDDVENSKDWKIYMGHTSKTEFSSESDWIDYENLTLVFSGEVILPETEAWIEIQLDFPFEYNNTDNLVVAVDENTDDWSTGGFFYTSEKPEISSLLWYDDNYNTDPENPGTADSDYSYIPNTRLLFGVPPSCQAPLQQGVSGVTESSALLTWQGEGTLFEVEIMPAVEEPDGIADSTGIAENSLQVENLISATAYKFYVRTDCGVDGKSAWRGPYEFTTDNCTLENSCNYRFEMVSQTGTGWDGTRIGIFQNGYEVAVFGEEFTIGYSYEPLYFSVCDQVQVVVRVVDAGIGSENVGFSIYGTNDELVYELETNNGGLVNGDDLYSYQSVCNFNPEGEEFLGITTYWSDPVNWPSGRVPGVNTDVKIANSKQVVVDLNYAKCRKLTILSGSNVSIDPNRSLKIFNSLINHANESGITVRSDATGTGSLLHYNAGIRGTFQRYIAMAPNWGQAGAAQWNYISSPVYEQPFEPNWTPTGENNDYDILFWDGEIATWLNQKLPANNLTHFEPARGYAVAYQQSGIHNFEGILNVASFSLNLPILESSWLPIGNPYPCALKWNTTDYMLDGFLDIAKAWNRTNGSYQDVIPEDIIPATNSFMAFADPHGGVVNIQMTMPAEARLISSTPFLKSAVKNRIVLKAKDKNSGLVQEFIIIQHPDAGNSFNGSCDAEFLPGYAPSFYALKDGKHLSAYGVKDFYQLIEFVCGFQKTESSDYEIILDTERSVPVGDFYLTDLKTGQKQNLRLNPVYSFTSQDGDMQERFRFQGGNVGIEENEDTKGITIWVSESGIQVSNPAAEFETWKLTALNGTLIQMGTMAGDQLIPTRHLTTGVYVLTLSGTKQTLNRKIIINK